MTHFDGLKKAGLAAALLGASAFAMTASADQQILDDLIVDGSICAGQDCVNGESFGFDTLRLKENNLRIRFFDTSNSASFPTRDWQLTANDSSNGGANKFSIDDIDGGRTPFTIEAGAPSHSLFVDDGGRIGVGTSTPVATIHAKTGNTPTLRLEQDGTSGFTPQTWDLAGNEANFFIRDATNGSTLPFRVFPGAPSNALVIEASTGDIGMGTTSPAAALDIKGTGMILEGPGNHLIDIESTDSGAVQFRLRSDGAGGNRRILGSDTAGNTQTQIKLDVDDIELLGPTGTDLWARISSAGIETMGPTCPTGTPCDGVFDPDFEIPSIEEHAEFMWENRHLPAVGPTLPSQPMNVTEKMGRMLNELEKAHIYIEQLNQDKQELKAEVAELKALEARIAQLEKLAVQ